MQPLAMTAMTVASALGLGTQPTLEELRARRHRLRPAEGPFGYIGEVDGLAQHRLPDALRPFDCRNNRLADMALRSDNFTDKVAAARERYGAGRIAVILGTSTAGIRTGEEAYRRRDPATGALPKDFDFANTQDLFALPRFVRAALGLRGPALTISTACASSARSFIDAAHLIRSGLCDAAVVGGADSLCDMTLSGFAALGLISPTPCRPCDANRAGISIGEAAGFALLERAGAAEDDGQMPVGLLGYGATSDGYHMSAPDPQGAGAIGAMRGALAGAGLEPAAVDYVNLHGTGTKANDAMEDVAALAVFGGDVPVSSTKGWTGHTLGASGIVEAVIGALCIRHGFMPGCLGVTEPDPAFRARVLTENVAAPVRRVMSNSFGFGGINCSLLLGALA
ncbi:MAG TPA: beta-ketoacyl-[acyl-carrier-protein] synthase family protein [Acetobacteraceae bacterium]|jgi:3-oxoacyl-[acyl-carrier-protein] synthase-1